MSRVGIGRSRRIQRQIDPLVTALEQARLHQGLSQTALAQRMGLATYGTISEHERGVNQPSLPLLRKWSAALGYDLVLEPYAKAAQERYDATHDPGDHHCLTELCEYHPGETRLRPLPTFPAQTTQHRSDCPTRLASRAPVADGGLRTKIEASSLGTPEAKVLRATVSDEHAARIVARAREMELTDAVKALAAVHQFCDKHQGTDFGHTPWWVTELRALLASTEGTDEGTR